MKNHSHVFDENEAIEHLRHYLPAQAALKDFVHHNTLHAFQHMSFHDALQYASGVFGYTTYLSLDEYRAYFKSGKIREDVLNRSIKEFLEKEQTTQYSFESLRKKMLEETYTEEVKSRLFELRSKWKSDYKINMDKSVQPILFRVLQGFMDQGISVWKFPTRYSEFLDALRELEQNGIASLFKTERPRKLLLENKSTISDLLKIVVGDESLYFHYLFDQQFSHPGWSGFVSVVEIQPETLLSKRMISLKDLIYIELLLEIDVLDRKFETNWRPLSCVLDKPVDDVFEKQQRSEINIIQSIWQEAFEWSYFDDVLLGVGLSEHQSEPRSASFQGLFCIDDREYSFRRYVEQVDPKSDTYGTPGFFGVEFFFQPEHGKFYTKACPAPVTPKYLIKEAGRKNGAQKDYHFSNDSHGLLRGWIYSNVIGFWSAVKLFLNIFKPSLGPATAYSFAHMDSHGVLQIESEGKTESNLNLGFSVDEMALRVKNTLSSIGLVKDFAPIVYVVGHGGTSVNNPYYAGYDCGACCGRPGAVNARVFAYMANHAKVRAILQKEGIDIPFDTVFIGAMHDTTRDEIEFYDWDMVPEKLSKLHQENKQTFHKALELNARERAFRFDTVNPFLPVKILHKKVKDRSVSLFEPRPEWNHTANALCIVGRKSLYSNLYLDKRPFINSYDYSLDQEGKYLNSILSAAVPVCGGINLEYYFSRVDQQRLGSGTKLPHNVVGLFAVANGVEGDLLPGLPSQMIEIHDPVRILYIIEHHPDVVLRVISNNKAIYEWIENEWVLFSVKDPGTGKVYRFSKGNFEPYEPLNKSLPEGNPEAYFSGMSVFSKVLKVK